MSVYCYPADCHASVCIHIIPITIYKYPTGLHCSPLIHVVPMSIYCYPAGAHCSPLVHIVPMSVYCYPAGAHCSPLVHIIPMVIYKYPAGLHKSVLFKVIPFSGNFFPANCFLTVFIIFPTVFCLNPAFIFNFYPFKISCNCSICFYCMNIRIFFAYFLSVNRPIHKSKALFRYSSQCCFCTFFILTCFTVKCHRTHDFIIYICCDGILF